MAPRRPLARMVLCCGRRAAWMACIRRVYRRACASARRVRCSAATWPHVSDVRRFRFFYLCTRSTTQARFACIALQLWRTKRLPLRSPVRGRRKLHAACWQVRPGRAVTVCATLAELIRAAVAPPCSCAARARGAMLALAPPYVAVARRRAYAGVPPRAPCSEPPSCIVCRMRVATVGAGHQPESRSWYGCWSAAASRASASRSRPAAAVARAACAERRARGAASRHAAASRLAAGGCARGTLRLRAARRRGQDTLARTRDTRSCAHSPRALRRCAAVPRPGKLLLPHAVASFGCWPCWLRQRGPGGACGKHFSWSPTQTHCAAWVPRLARACTPAPVLGRVFGLPVVRIFRAHLGIALLHLLLTRTRRRWPCRSHAK